MASVITMQLKAVAPLMDWVAWKNISMNGNPVGVIKTAWISPIANKVAISMPKPSAPLSVMLVMMERGTLSAAFWISSDILSILAG